MQDGLRNFIDHLHAAGYYLYPQLQYEDKFFNVDEVRKGLYECMDRMLGFENRLKAEIQLDLYDQANGDFGSRIAIEFRKLRSRTSWWMHFGSSTPELQKFVVQVLSLTCSASVCERNLSTFEYVVNLYSYIFVIIFENFQFILSHKFIYFIICRFIQKRE